MTRLYDEMYARLQHGRLVLVGGPGAGKTGALLLLMLEALARRAQITDTAARAMVPVPVWLALGSWDPREQGLREWAAAALARDHPYLGAVNYGPDAPAGLLDGGRVALFLDGLDEMPEGMRTRAAQRLRLEAAGLRIVLTSRPEEYRSALEAGGGPDALTAVVDLKPVTSKTAVDYLLKERSPAQVEAWQPVIDQMRTPDSLLARTLNTPLTLSLARSTYATADPAALLAPDLDTPERVRGHLLDRALTVAYPDQNERDHASYWLGWLAHNLDTRISGRTRNLRWWDIPTHLPTWQLRFVVGLIFIFGLIFGGASVLMDWLPGAIIGWLVIVLMIRSGIEFAKVPKVVIVRWLTLGDLGKVIASGLFGGFGGGLVGAVVGAVVGAAVGAVTSVTGVGLDGVDAGLDTLGFACMLGCLGGLGLGAIAGVQIEVVAEIMESWTQRTDASGMLTPHSTYRGDRIGGLVAGVVGWGVFGLWAVLAGGELVIGIATGLVCGLLVGLASGLSSAAGQLRLAEVLLRVSGKGRVRFMPLLETALQRQVLRQVGTVYQFRHAELQDRLAAWFVRENVRPAASRQMLDVTAAEARAQLPR